MCNRETFYFPFFTIYDHRTRPYRIQKTIANTDGVESIVEYEYNSPLNKLAPTAQEITNSDNKVHRTTYLYGDSDTDLTEHGMTGVLLEERNYVDGQLIGGSGTNYANFTFGGVITSKPILSYQIGASGEEYPIFSISEYTTACHIWFKQKNI